jgi:hypothetical protein
MTLRSDIQKNFVFQKTKKGSLETSMVTFDAKYFLLSDPKCSLTFFTMKETTKDSPGLL